MNVGIVGIEKLTPITRTDVMSAAQVGVVAVDFW